MGKFKGILYVMIGAILLFVVGYMIFTAKKMGI